jgi:hypothetical protein
LTSDGPRQVALLTEGHHKITLSNPLTGAEAHTWIEVLTK